MNSDLSWAILAALVVFGWIGIGFARERIRAHSRMRLREMLHQERMAALEKGIDVPETDTDDILMQSLADNDAVTGPASASSSVSDRTLRLAVLGLGLVLTLGGIGWYVGMAAVPQTRWTVGMPEMASLGAIPSMVGVGLLIFWLTLRREGR